MSQLFTDLWHTVTQAFGAAATFIQSIPARVRASLRSST